MIKIEEVKKNFLEWCKGFLSTHVDYKVDMPFDLDFVAEGIWNKIEQDYEQLIFLEEKQSRSVEIPEPFIVQDRDGRYRIYSSQVNICRYANIHAICDTPEAAEACLKEVKEGKEE